ncbi:AMP-binding protein [Gordonia sp. TBRC 11910]|uniref:AMP-binding protein n=1 Tax=Gordonia asplenii TaxID=2725283 RepID=A0A848KPJ6_9ACTN|nr:AMP-binding protein [Gordonia asplenii]NMO00596.1 AMP-binding protein [Gordonia asplenii]
MSHDVHSLYNRRADNRWDRTAVGDLLERVTWSTPDKLALIGVVGAYAHPQHQRLTYRQADEIANRFANGLRAHGLTRGDVVMLFCDNSVEAILAKIAIAKAGLVAAPVNTMMAPDVIAGLIELVEPKLVIADESASQQVRDVFAAAGLDIGVTIDLTGQSSAEGVTFADFYAGQEKSEPKVVIHGDDIWQILFTSGTTSAPKGVMISHHAAYAAGTAFALDVTRGLRLATDLVLCSFLPIVYHVGELPFVFSTLMCGGTFVVGRKPDPAQIAQTIAAQRVTALWAGSPAMLSALDDVVSADPALDVGSLTIAVYGWAALAPAVLASLKRRCSKDFQVFAIFGQTEAIACHRFWPDSWRELYERTAPRDNYVGVPSSMLASKITDVFGGSIGADGGPDGSAGPGEAVYRSPAVMSGYYRNAQATADAFQGGWFHSGDSCVIGEDGQRIMVDRFKDIVKSGGENVSTMRVEAVLLGHPDVERVAVVGLPHERWGEAVTAVVVRAASSELSANELIEWARERLAGFETPKQVVFAPTLPDTVGGKVLKYKLRQEYSGLYET